MQQTLQPSGSLWFRGEEVLAAGYQAVWFLFQGKSFDVGRCYRPDGTFTGYYVDILEPVAWRGDDALTLEPIVDLFLDVWVAPDAEFTVLDEDELADAVAAGAISAAQEAHARRTLAEIEALLRRGEFPPAEVRKHRT